MRRLLTLLLLMLVPWPSSGAPLSPDRHPGLATCRNNWTTPLAAARMLADISAIVYRHVAASRRR